MPPAFCGRERLDANVLARYFVEEANANSATEAHLRTMQP
jgi:hypothetical protein